MTDEQLIKAAQNGNYAEFEELVKKYQDKVYRLCLRFLIDRDDADDAAQEVFVKVYRSLDRFKREAQFSTWLYRIAVNHCLNLLRARRRKEKLMFFSRLGPDERIGLLQKASDEDLQQRLERDEAKNKIVRALKRLNEDQRTALLLHRYEGLSYQEIAEIMGVSVSCIESRLFRAKKKLWQILAEPDKG